MIKIGDNAPLFSLPDQEGVIHSLADYKGKTVIIYFYPKDDTPGCTTEACEVRDNIDEFRKLGVEIFGISADSTKKHKAFATKYDLPFPLLSDESHEVCEAYGVWKEKKFMGKSYMGIERTTFTIGEDGKIKHIFEKVKPAGHAALLIKNVS